LTTALVIGLSTVGEAPPTRWRLLLQAEAIASSLAALLWLFFRQQSGRSLSAKAEPLLTLQVALPLAAIAATLALPVAWLVAQPGDLPADAVAACGWPTWLGLLTTTAAVASYAHCVPRASGTHLLAWLGLELAALSACTVATAHGAHWLGYHVLTAGCAAVAAFIPAFGVRRGHAGAAMAWSALASVLVLALALRGASLDPAAPWPSVAALVFVSGLAADWAVARRSGAWAFAAGWPLYLTVSLLLWHRHQPWDWSTDGPFLARANLLTAGLFALVWLAVRARWARTGALRGSPDRWLGLQVTLAVAGNLALLAGPLASIIVHPAELPAGVAQAGGVAGWAALLAALVPTALVARDWFACLPGLSLTALGLPQGILAACTAALWDRGDWAAYHTLAAAWTLLGAGLTAAYLPRDNTPGCRSGTGAAALCAAGVGLLVMALGVREVLEASAGAIWIVAGGLLVIGHAAAWIARWRGSP
jgi:hypothetical protein